MHNHGNEHNTHSESEHRMGYGQAIIIWLGLIGLTGATVAFSGINLGRWIVATALLIASVKSYIVLSNFMHLRFEDTTFKVFVAVAIATLSVFFILMFFDYAFV